MNSADATDKLIEEIIVDAYGEDEQLWAFRQVIEDEVSLPAEGTVIGETVQVTKIDYDGNPQRGLRVSCRKPGGKAYEVALEDVEFPADSKAAPYIAAYRKWLGVPQPAKSRRAEYREKIKQTKVQVGEIDIDKPVDLIVMGIRKQEMARCRLLEAEKEITLRSAGVWGIVPGEIATVMPRKHWSFAGHPYLAGDVTATRFDLAALNLTPLNLAEQGQWDPDNEYWGDDEEPLDDWEKEIIARGPRPEYKLENIIPGRPEDFDIDTDPIVQAVELKNNDNPMAAFFALNKLLVADLRCLDAHAHLGNLAFDHSPETALRHYDIGRQIGELSLGNDFQGLLRWGLIDNRPYLRCLHGYGLCLWRLKRFDEATAIFSRMLWLNPSDNQGARFNLAEVRDGIEWQDREE